jgi:MFS transporter, CP family, cyanate transporter
MLGILAVAFNLRVAVVSVGPVLEHIRADTRMSSAVAGVMTMIPFVCMGAFSVAGAPLIRRLGVQRTVTVAMLAIVAGTLVRAGTTSALVLLAATVPIGVGIALANSALAAVVKDRFPGRPGAVTGAYVAAQSIGTASVMGGMVPLSDAVGGWRTAFALSAAPGLLAVVVWVTTRAGERQGGGDLPRGAGALPTRTVWLLGLVFAFQSICYSAVVSWGPAVFTDAGATEGHAGLLVAILPVLTIPVGLLIPALSDGRDRRPALLACTAVQTVGMLAIALAPAASPWLWMVLFAVGNGGCFALALTLPLDYARDPHEAAWLTSWVLGIGFLISALSPVVVGALRDVTGGFAVPMALVAVLGTLCGGLAMRVRPA